MYGDTPYSEEVRGAGGVDVFEELEAVVADAGFHTPSVGQSARCLSVRHVVSVS
jgi:hypothetical protein